MFTTTTTTTESSVWFMSILYLAFSSCIYTSEEMNYAPDVRFCLRQFEPPFTAWEIPGFWNNCNSFVQMFWDTTYISPYKPLTWDFSKNCCHHETFIISSQSCCYLKQALFLTWLYCTAFTIIINFYLQDLHCSSHFCGSQLCWQSLDHLACQLQWPSQTEGSIM